MNKTIKKRKERKIDIKRNHADVVVQLSQEEQDSYKTCKSKEEHMLNLLLNVLVEMKNSYRRIDCLQKKCLL